MKPKARQRKSYYWDWSSSSLKADINKGGVLPSLTMNSAMASVSNEFKPYAGPTLWTPWSSKKETKFPFLTLTPAGGSSTCTGTLPLVSLTPRMNDDPELLTRSGFDSDEFLQYYDKDEREREAISLPPISTNTLPHIHMESRQGHNADKKLQNGQSQPPIIPDVFCLPLTKYISRKANRMVEIPYVPYRDQQIQRNSGNDIHWSFRHGSLGDREDGILPTLSERNEQDKGTLYSKQHKALYRRLAREPSFLPVIQNDTKSRQIFDESGTEGDGDMFSHDPNDNKVTSGSQTKALNFTTRLSKQQRQARRNYIRSHAHFATKKSSIAASTSASLGCKGHQATSNPITSLAQTTDFYVTKNKEERQSNSNSYEYPRQHCERSFRRTDIINANSLPSHSKPERVSRTQSKIDKNSCQCDIKKVKSRLVSAQFCDVLGQRACRRCQEFYAKNFTHPPKEKAEVIRSPDNLTRESTIIVPNVGLQKIVIRVKDNSGKTEVTSVEVNPGFV